MNRIASLSFLLLIALPTAGIAETVTFEKPNWTREGAAAALAISDTRPSLARLFRLARAGDNDALMAEIVQIQASRDLSDPARDQLLHRFAVGLGDLPAGSVDRAVLDRLMAYRPATRVPDEHRPSVGVPLYNVRAAAAGSLNEWNRQAAWSESERLLRRDGEAWIEAWLAADAARRSGLLDSLPNADPDQLRQLGRAALARSSASPELGGVAARAALSAQDPELFREAIVRGGSGLSEALRSAPAVFAPADTADILRHALRSAPPESGALALAHLAAPLLDEPEVAELVIGTLSHRELGSAAALVLAGSDDPALRAELARLAKEGSALQKQRAVLSVQLAAQRRGEDLR